MSDGMSIAMSTRNVSEVSAVAALEPLDVSAYSIGRKQPLESQHGPRPAIRPAAFLTTISSLKPVEFASDGVCHNFNLQLSGAPLVNWIAGGRGRMHLVAPGHVSLNVAHEPFRCVVWPTAELLTLHISIPPDWIARVREEEVVGSSSQAGGLTPTLGKWQPQVRDVALRLAEMVRFGTAKSLLLDQLHLSLAVELIRLHDGGRAKPHPSGRMAIWKLRDVIEYMRAHIGDAVALADLASLADLSPFHFARSFKANIGVSPHRYLTELRLQQARLMLATTDQAITDIALSHGFDTPSHFSNTFRSRFGVSPTMFRKNVT